MTGSIRLPVSAPGRKSAAAQELYDDQVRAFCAAALEFRSRLDFPPSSRGWCYVLEGYGLGKGDFDRAEKLINDCRKDGRLPLDICAEDASREAIGLIDTTERGPEEHARWAMETAAAYHVDEYTPFDLWDGLDVYIEMVVEKIDLRSLFEPVCEEYQVPLTNVRGWADLHSRARLMERMKRRGAEGKPCILLLCFDHDPGGLLIADVFRKNLSELTRAVGWDPLHLEIVRFGLNADFIESHGLTWIDNLETGSGQDLTDPGHRDHRKSHVQDYIRQFGPRKVEANALLRDPEAGRDLCREAIERYVAKSDLDRHSRRLKRARREAWSFVPAAARRYAARLSKGLR